jgi:hypothetical protein
MSKTIIFFTVYPFNSNFYEKYQFDYLMNQGYSIKIFNIFQILYQSAVGKLVNYSKLENINGISQEKIQSIGELDRCIKKIKGKKVVFMICNQSHEVLKVLSGNNVKYVTFENGVLNFNNNYGIITKFMRNFCNYSSILEFVVYAYKKIIKGKNKSAALNYKPCITLVNRNQHELCLKENNVKYLHVNSFDKDLVSTHKSNLKPTYLPDGDYFVLLANHPWLIHDYVLSGHTKSYVDKERYQLIINKFLDKVESRTNTPVLIAAYPKAEKDENIYDGRPFIYDTEQLVKYSSGVISHHTGGINFSVLHNKPICMIGLRAFPKYCEFSLLNHSFASELGVPLYYIDGKNDEDFIRDGMFSYNAKKYKEYKYKYLVSEKNPNKPIFEALSNELKECL